MIAAKHWGKWFKGKGIEELKTIRHHYKKLLWGTFDESNNEVSLMDLLQLNYDEVSINMNQYVILLDAELSTGHILKYYQKNGSFDLKEVLQTESMPKTEYEKRGDVDEIYLEQNKIIKVTPPKMMYTNQRIQIEKCYSFQPPHVPYEKLKQFNLHVRPSIFLESPVVRPRKNQFSVSFHYPNQKIKSISQNNGWNSKFERSKFYERKYYITNIEVLTRRSKPNDPCIEGNYDDTIGHDAAEFAGCVPLGIKVGNKTNICQKKNDIRKFQRYMNEMDHTPPCVQIRSMDQGNGEFDTNQTTGWKKNPRLVLQFYLPESFYKDITYVKAYTVESLIGNAGGYIGEFILQF